MSRSGNIGYFLTRNIGPLLRLHLEVRLEILNFFEKKKEKKSPRGELGCDSQQELVEYPEIEREANFLDCI